MRLLLILVGLSVSNAQNDLAATTNWLLEILNNNATAKSKELGNRFSLSQIKNPDVPHTCTLPNNDEGLCVNPLLCAEEPPPSDPTTRFIYREASCPISLMCCPINSVIEDPKPPKTLPTVCGVSNPGGHNFRISNPKSDFSKFAEFPWTVALLTPTHSSPLKAKEYIGGGSLIHPSVVLTVAHKVMNLSSSQIKCRAGEWDTTNEFEILPHQDRNVKKIVMHERFDIINAYYDAALLFLESPFDLEGFYHIGVACLAPDVPAPGTLCYGMGWGKSLGDTYATTLKKIQLPIVQDSTCTSQMRKTKLGPNYRLHPSLMCAGGEEGVDTCIGDGGSPLVCSLPNYNSLKRFAVHGMVVYGMGCGLKDVPGVYAKVPWILDWVNQKMEEENLTKTYVI